MNNSVSWVSQEVEDLLNEESSKLKRTRESVSRRFGVNDNEIIKEDLGFVAMPEILSAQYCALFGNMHLLEISPPLQAFLSYAISIYDILSDNHLYKNGKPTFLKTHERDAVLIAEVMYKKVIRELSIELGKNVPGAAKIIYKMYYGTIRWDKARNSKIVSPSEAFLLQDKLAGEHAYSIAVLSKAEEFGQFSSHLVNAMTTLEDLIDLFKGEDFTGSKTTIPIAFLAEEFGYVPEKIRTIRESLAIKRAKKYVNRQIVNCRRTLPLHKTPSTNLLLRIVEDIDKFNGRFPEEYL